MGSRESRTGISYPLSLDLHASGPIVLPSWAWSDQFSCNSRSVNLFSGNRRENNEQRPSRRSVARRFLQRETTRDPRVLLLLEIRIVKKKRCNKIDLAERRVIYVVVTHVLSYSTCLSFVGGCFAKMAASTSMAMLWGSGALGHFDNSTLVCRAESCGGWSDISRS